MIGQSLDTNPVFHSPGLRAQIVGGRDAFDGFAMSGLIESVGQHPTLFAIVGAIIRLVVDFDFDIHLLSNDLFMSQRVKRKVRHTEIMAVRSTCDESVFNVYTLRKKRAIVCKLWL